MSKITSRCDNHYCALCATCARYAAQVEAIISHKPDLEGGGCSKYLPIATKSKPRLDIFQQLCVTEGLPTPVREYQFAPPRKWKSDYYIEHNGKKIALEVEGGIYTQGRHTRGSGFVKDMEKYNALSTQGIILLRTAPKQLLSYKTVLAIQTILNST